MFQLQRNALHRGAHFVDVDEAILGSYQGRAVPLIADHIIHRETPLRVEVLKGSIDASVECLKNTDAVIAIEIIEHLYPDVLENVPYNIFGFIQPKLAIFSTPNSDYNVLFTPLKNGFRHLDHKFEWSQEQFKDWALNICERFPNYRVAILGVGDVPEGHPPDLGPVSQIALFVRKDVQGIPLQTDLEVIPADIDIEYKEIYAVDFPMYRDDRTPEQKIFDEASFFINQYRTIELYHNPERLIYQIPFERILEGIHPVTESATDLRRILLEKGHLIEDGFVILPEEDSNRMDRRWSDDDDSYYDFDIYEDDEEDEDSNSSSHETGLDQEANYEEAKEEECWD